mgnify:CR=1 FL=1
MNAPYTNGLPSGNCPTKTEAQVPTQVTGCMNDIEDLSKAIAELEVRLCAVLRPNAPSDKKGEGPISVSLVGLAEVLRDVRTRIYLTKTAVDSILSRLEL